MQRTRRCWRTCSDTRAATTRLRLRRIALQTAAEAATGDHALASLQLLRCSRRQLRLRQPPPTLGSTSTAATALSTRVRYTRRRRVPFLLAMALPRLVLVLVHRPSLGMLRLRQRTRMARVTYPAMRLATEASTPGLALLLVVRVQAGSQAAAAAKARLPVTVLLRSAIAPTAAASALQTPRTPTQAGARLSRAATRVLTTMTAMTMGQGTTGAASAGGPASKQVAGRLQSALVRAQAVIVGPVGTSARASMVVTSLVAASLQRRAVRSWARRILAWQKTASSSRATSLRCLHRCRRRRPALRRVLPPSPLQLQLLKRADVSTAMMTTKTRMRRIAMMTGQTVEGMVWPRSCRSQGAAAATAAPAAAAALRVVPVALRASGDCSATGQAALVLGQLAPLLQLLQRPLQRQRKDCPRSLHLDSAPLAVAMRQQRMQQALFLQLHPLLQLQPCR